MELASLWLCTVGFDRDISIRKNTHLAATIIENNLPKCSVVGEQALQGVGVNYFIEWGSYFERVNIFYFGHCFNYFIGYIIDGHCCGLCLNH